MLLLVALLDASFTVSTLAVGFGCIYGVAVLASAGLVERGALTVALSLACPLVTMTAYISPIPVVLEAVRSLNAQNLPLQVFQSQAVCNILSICYGIQITNAAVLITNMFGLLMQVLFLAADHYVRSSSAGWMFFATKLSVGFNIGLYVFAALTPINILGHFISVFNIILFAAPLAKLGSILRTRNSSSLPTAMTCISGVNNGVWTLYALLIEDDVVLLPSVLGFLLSTFQVLVIVWCKGGLPYDLSYLLLRSRDGCSFLRSSVAKDVELQDMETAADVFSAVATPLVAKLPFGSPRALRTQLKDPAKI